MDLRNRNEKSWNFFKKKRIFLLSLWFLERPESRFPFISLINDLKKFRLRRAIFYTYLFFFFPFPSLSGAFTRRASV